MPVLVASAGFVSAMSPSASLIIASLFGDLLRDDGRKDDSQFSQNGSERGPGIWFLIPTLLYQQPYLIWRVLRPAQSVSFAVFRGEQVQLFGSFAEGKDLPKQDSKRPFV